MTGLNNLTKTDEELMEAYKMGEFYAFDLLYTRYNNKIFAYFYAKTSSKEISDDLAQKVFLKLHKKKDLYHKKYLFVSWLFTVAKNTLKDYFKKVGAEKQKITTYTEHLITDTQINPTNIGCSLITAHYQNIGLNKAQIEVLILKFEKDFSYEEISQAINSNPTNVRKIVSRTLQKIKNNYTKLKELQNE